MELFIIIAYLGIFQQTVTNELPIGFLLIISLFQLIYTTLVLLSKENDLTSLGKIWFVFGLIGTMYSAVTIHGIDLMKILFGM